MKDIFGRDRHTSHRDDMSGAGSFQMNTRTLYIGGVKRSEGQDLPKIVEKHFEEWGEVEQVNVIYRLSVAFVRYRLRTNAEFAREAMGHQSLENKGEYSFLIAVLLFFSAFFDYLKINSNYSY